MTIALPTSAHNLDEGTKLLLGPIYTPRLSKGYAYWPNGAMVIAPDGSIVAIGEATSVLRTAFGNEASFNNLSESLPKTVEVHQYDASHLLIPGLIDLHTHLPQWKVRARLEPNLLAWLDDHILPEEERFADVAYAQQVATEFFDALVANGTTTTALFLTSHPHLVDIAFKTAKQKGVRLITGLNLMDTEAKYPGPASLSHPPEELLTITESLCQQWHNPQGGQSFYAWVPRYALSCSSRLFEGLGQLRQQYPDVWCHTHLAEQKNEVTEVLTAFSEASSYTGVYEQFGLLGPRTLLAHSIHLNKSELALIKKTNASLVHCPSANFFLKSGVFDWQKMSEKEISFGLGSDVGAGYSLFMGDVMRDAYMIQPTLNIPARELLYRSTLGAAQSLGLENLIGSLEPGKQADVLVLKRPQPLTNNPGTDSPQAAINIDSFLSEFIFTGDDRWVKQSMVRGEFR